MLPLLRIFGGIAPGEVQERLNWPPWKGGILVRVSWVRIPPSPPFFISPALLLHKSAHDIHSKGGCVKEKCPRTAGHFLFTETALHWEVYSILTLSFMKVERHTHLELA